MAVHYFDTTGQAYDACQCDPKVTTGDTLVIESEQVVGVADTWPVAVTRAAGALHRKAPDCPWDELTARTGLSPQAITEAQIYAETRGWPLDKPEPPPRFTADDAALIRRALETHLTLATLTQNTQDEKRTRALLKRLS